MYHVKTCNGYQIEGTFESLAEAIQFCRAREEKAQDSYARVVSCDGRLIADAAGEWKMAPQVDPMDVALERRFD
jgi:hypothetical protein